MNRFVRPFISAASIVGGLLAAPSLAHAQVINVAPPAYATPAPYQSAPVPAQSWVGDVAYGGDRRSDWYNGSGNWQRERWDGARRQHLRECWRAYEHGAPYWVLERMRCPVR
jgi:hypothetical protein